MHTIQSSPVTLEVCADSLASAAAARDGGADRIELCAGMEVGGITPDYGLVEAVVRAVNIPVHVMIRPRGGDFLYSESEYAQMKENVDTFRRLGCAGIVTGFLDATIFPDVNRIAEMVRLAGGMTVTFHRAIDLTPDIFTAGAIIAKTGVRRILTSGGAADATAGAPVIARLVEEIGNLIFIAAGGITATNAAAIVRSTGVSELHSWRGVSVLAQGGPSGPAGTPGSADESATARQVDPGMVSILKKMSEQRP